MHPSTARALGALALIALPALRSAQQPATNASTEVVPTAAAQVPFVPESHVGDWSGPNRLWVFDPAKPYRSDGTLSAASRSLTYTWSYEGKAQTGEMELFGQPGALRAEWVDTWHAAEGITLNGFVDEGVVRLFATYPAGEGVDWGWRIELDLRDPEAFDLRMFNVMPDIGVVPAVVLHGTR